MEFSKLMVTLKKRVIVKLGEAGQSHCAPMFPQRLKDGGRVQLAHGPGCYQSSVQGNPIEHSHFSATFDHQSFDHIETIQLAMTPSQRRQIPTWERRTASHSPLSIQSSSSLQDAPDGANRRWVGQSLGQPLASNRYCAEFTQIAVLTQLMTYPQNPVFFKTRCTPSLMRNRSARGPIHLVKLKPLRTLEPSLDCSKTDSELSCYRAHRCTATNRFDHCFTPFLSGGFLAMCRTPTSNNSDSTDTQVLASTLTPRYSHLSLHPLRFLPPQLPKPYSHHVFIFHRRR